MIHRGKIITVPKRQPPANEKESGALEARLGRAERVLSMSRAMLGVVITVMLLLVFSLVNGEPDSASYVVCVLTMGLNILFMPYIFYTTNKYVRIRHALIKALEQRLPDASEHSAPDAKEHSVLETLELELTRREF